MSYLEMLIGITTPLKYLVFLSFWTYGSIVYFGPLEIRCGQVNSGQQNVRVGICVSSGQEHCTAGAQLSRALLSCWVLWKHTLIWVLCDWSRLECWLSTRRMAAPERGPDLQRTSNFKLLRFFHFYCSIAYTLSAGDMETDIETIQSNSSKT